ARRAPRRAYAPRAGSRAVAGEPAEARFGEADRHVPAAHAKVAGERELEAAAKRRAADRGERWHRHGGERTQHHVLEQDLALARILAQMREFPDVAAGAQRAH